MTKTETGVKEIERRNRWRKTHTHIHVDTLTYARSRQRGEEIIKERIRRKRRH